MTRDELIRITAQCQLVTAGNRDGVYMDALAKFAEIVAAAEREACAKACELLNEDFDSLYVESCAEAIRARENA